MSDDDDRLKQLEKLVALKSAKATERLLDELTKEQQSKMENLAVRGIQGGPTIAVLRNIALKRIDGMARGHYNAYKEVYESAGLLSPERLREKGAQLATSFDAGRIVKILEEHPFARRVFPGDSLEQAVADETYKIKARFLHDIEIDAISLAVAPQPETVVSGSGQFQYTYDVFMSFATPNKDVAEVALRLLEEKGLKVFFSPKALQGGDPWEEVIRVALVGSREQDSDRSTANR